MKFAVTNDQIRYFKQEQSIEFESLLTTEQLAEGIQLIERAIDERNIEGAPAEAPFLSGHNLFTHNKLLRRWITRRAWAEIAASLSDCRPLQIAFDQLLIPHPRYPLNPHEEGAYWSYLKNSHPLTPRSSVRPLACGLLLALDSRTTNEEVTILPALAGHGVFFSPLLNLDFSLLLGSTQQRFLMIAYTQGAQYLFCEDDPHTHALKKMGYGFGDHLTLETHPILFR